MTIAEIQELVCQAYGVRLRDLRSERRTRSLVEPRHVAMWLAREVTPHTMAVIGRSFGHRDNTSVWHAVNMIEAKRRADPSFAIRLGALRVAIDQQDELAEAKADLARVIAEAKAEMRAAA